MHLIASAWDSWGKSNTVLVHMPVQHLTAKSWSDLHVGMTH